MLFTRDTSKIYEYKKIKSHRIRPPLPCTHTYKLVQLNFKTKISIRKKRGISDNYKMFNSSGKYNNFDISDIQLQSTENKDQLYKEKDINP